LQIERPRLEGVMNASSGKKPPGSSAPTKMALLVTGVLGVDGEVAEDDGVATGVDQLQRQPARLPGEERRLRGEKFISTCGCWKTSR
jgi:hypothetical protein